MSKQMKSFLKEAGKFQMGEATLLREAMNDNNWLTITIPIVND